MRRRTPRPDAAGHEYSPSPPPARVPAVLVGLLAGGAAGFLLTGTVGAFSAFVLGRALDVADTGGVLLAAFVAVPLICGVLGAVIAFHRAGHNRRCHHPGR
ncbi:hypothetical protein PV755_31030 [Streptomyces caniscabiei]|uniref:Uncharacterized protein n=1 Tax=Streptomyces caniscabiei TaxID=2746961 RepID=A0A927QG30_9ACTN|nr:hypothetical protein [Streptomyces caniscabiei]MBD9724305.1 hypothetical protein [Streptomyces caniscabiei]MDX3513295.1 hypothetical protein [Streptomyces caniscabiei]MDX3718796.1 hypothetical protein [Streptomyces caniscabiei]MDX3727449.1 hypothetical protein [Streptomyces caniscabiei]WEO21818.1 hypothetical protein IHE65_00950 [Streptomyces caniscabiei]